MALTTTIDPRATVTREQLEKIFHLKYGSPEATGWGPRSRWKAGHFNPADYYEAIVEQLVPNESRWLDVGCGRNLFPRNEPLAKLLSERCRLLVGIESRPDACCKSVCP